ncbi:hypothetical protein VCJ_000204 [Vibrio metoecus]|nr:hypothetical protein VCJ_000204 [Vibrio metoecus]
MLMIILRGVLVVVESKSGNNRPHKKGLHEQPFLSAIKPLLALRLSHR